MASNNDYPPSYLKRHVQKNTSTHVPRAKKAHSRFEWAWPRKRERLLRAEDCVFGCLGNPKLDDFFCFYFYGLTSCRIPAHTSLALYKN